MPQMKNFTTAARESEREELTFAIDGRDCVAFVPTSTQLGIFSASFSDDAKSADSAFETMQLLRGVLDAKTFAYFRGRLDDPEDAFDFSNPVSDVISWLYEEATARPTEPRSDSSGSRDNTGSSSTAASRSKGSTRSRSTRVGSATSSTSGPDND